MRLKLLLIKRLGLLLGLRLLLGLGLFIEIAIAKEKERETLFSSSSSSLCPLVTKKAATTKPKAKPERVRGV